jgi:hypothetical protein
MPVDVSLFPISCEDGAMTAAPRNLMIFAIRLPLQHRYYLSPSLYCQQDQSPSQRLQNRNKLEVNDVDKTLPLIIWRRIFPKF